MRSLAIILLVASAHAQASIPAAAAQLLAEGADAYWTDYNAHGPGFREHDALGRPFVSSRPMLVASMSAEAAISLYAGHWLKSRGHPRLARLLQLVEIGGHSYGAAQSYRNRNLK
jgi:hypothetical protein